MSYFKIQGGRKLHGSYTVAGNKNAALPILAATLLTDEPCIIENLPDIRDVRAMISILQNMGKQINKIDDHQIEITGSVINSAGHEDHAGRLRASLLCWSGLLLKTGQIIMPPPGGCVIGRRKLDTHEQVIEAFGGELSFAGEKYLGTMKQPQPAELFLREMSVTATENALMLAAGVPGRSLINNAASDPHVTDLIHVLEKMGALIEGAGSPQLTVEGAKELHGFQHRIMPDYVEAGTLAIAAACTQSELLIHDALQKDLHMTSIFLEDLNVNLHFDDPRTLHIFPSQLKARRKRVQSGVWPAFPTDLMSPMIVLATQTAGTILCHDWMYESRMFFVDKLIVMGADITQCDPHRVLVSGPTKLRGQKLSSPDIRAGIALVIAALAADGESVIDNAEIIDRGYENIVERLNALGADIERCE